MISQTAEYALRAVVFLAKGNGQPMTRQQIADGGHVPLDYLTKVMQMLSEQGIVSVKRGPGGGYLLVGERERLTVLDVVAAVDVSLRVKRCPLGIVGHEALCPLHAKLDEAAALAESVFRETRIVDLASSTIPGSGKEPACSFPPLDIS